MCSGLCGGLVDHAHVVNAVSQLAGHFLLLVLFNVEAASLHVEALLAVPVRVGITGGHALPDWRVAEGLCIAFRRVAAGSVPEGDGSSHW